MHSSIEFLPRGAMLARVLTVVMCLCVCPSYAGIVAKRLHGSG